MKTIKLNENQLHEIIKESVKRVLNETELDYDIDNFSGRWGRGPRYNILVDDYVYYRDVPDESVDKLCAQLERQGEENIQVVEL